MLLVGFRFIDAWVLSRTLCCCLFLQSAISTTGSLGTWVWGSPVKLPLSEKLNLSLDMMLASSMALGPGLGQMQKYQVGGTGG